jgi:glycosyltransferase involved in cell wall biosynthesis
VRVLHVTPSIARTYGGPTQSLSGYVRAAAETGAEVTVAAPASSAADAELFTKEAGRAQLLMFRSRGSAAYVSSPDMWRWLARNARRFDCVHVHGLLNPISSLATRLTAVRGVPCIVRPFGTLSRYTFSHRRRELKWLYFRCLDGPNLRRVAGVHFTTSSEQAEAAWHGVQLCAKSFVIPPPWGGIAPATGERAPWPVAAFVSRLHPVKDVEGLLLAWRHVLRSVPDARLVIAGSGEPAYVAGLRSFAEGLGLAGSVEFAGFVSGEAKRRLLEQAWLFVLPSHHENFGVAVLDAMAMGLAVVVTPQVQLAPFVAEQGLGRVVERSPDRLARAIIETIGDGPMRDRCAALGPAVVARSFSASDIGSRLLEMYRAVSGRTGTQPRNSRVVHVRTGS